MKNLSFIALVYIVFTVQVSSQDDLLFIGEPFDMLSSIAYQENESPVNVNLMVGNNLSPELNSILFYPVNFFGPNPINERHSLVQSIKLKDKNQKPFHLPSPSKANTFTLSLDEGNNNFFHIQDNNRLNILMGPIGLNPIRIKSTVADPPNHQVGKIVLGSTIGFGIGILTGIMLGENEKTEYKTVSCPTTRRGFIGGTPLDLRFFGANEPCTPGTFPVVKESTRPIMAAVLGIAGGFLGGYITNQAIIKGKNKNSRSEQIKGHLILH